MGPNCLGSNDGKHVVIRAPNNSGSLYYNYKGTYPIVLLAVVDTQYCFGVVDVGSYGRTSNGGVLANSIFGQALRAGTVGKPEDALLPGADNLGPKPFVFVADEVFLLRRDLMQPFVWQPQGFQLQVVPCWADRIPLVFSPPSGVCTEESLGSDLAMWMPV